MLFYISVNETFLVMKQDAQQKPDVLYIERSTRKYGIGLVARTCPRNQRDDDDDDDDASQLMLFAIIMSDYVLLLQTHCRSNSGCLSRQT